MRTVGELLEAIKALQTRNESGEDVTAELAQLREELGAAKHHQQLAETRQGSRFAGPNSSEEVARLLASGQAIQVPAVADLPGGGGAAVVVAPHGELSAPVDHTKGNAYLRDMVSAKMGDARAHQRLVQGQLERKGWLEGTPSAGGYMVAPDQLPGFLEKRRASAPLRQRCTVRQVTSDEVHVVTEENTVTVQHVAEATTIPATTGSVGLKVATNYKAAGVSNLSTELLEDTDGNAGELVARQFGQQIGITQDVAILSGTGIGQPTGIRVAGGVNAQAVDGQTALQLYQSVVKALGRIRQRFWTPDTVALHGRDAVKFLTAVDADDRPLFAGGLPDALTPGMVVEDANVPTNLGAGTNESVIIVGDFRNGAMFFEREPLKVEASADAGWFTDEVSMRGRERYGFAVVRPECFEILTGITP